MADTLPDQPVVKFWEALVLAILPGLVALILVLQAHNVSRVITSLLFVLLPFGLFPTMLVADQVRSRIMARMARRRVRRQRRGS